MARALVLLSLCLLATASCSIIKNPPRFRQPTPLSEESNDDGMVFHDENSITNGQHITLVLNNDSDDDSDKESSLGIFRVIMDIVTKRGVSELGAQQNPDSSEMTDITITNEIDGDGRDEITPTHKTTKVHSWPWSQTRAPSHFTIPANSPSIPSSTTSPSSTTTSLGTTTERPRPHPHPRGCRFCDCWQKCRQRKYNWGICLCGKCHCYY